MILLGATPELRLLAHRQGMHVTGYDRSSEVFEQLRPADVPPAREDFVHGDWLTAANRGRGDLLLAHGSRTWRRRWCTRHCWTGSPRCSSPTLAP